MRPMELALVWRARGSLGSEGRRTLVVHFDDGLTGLLHPGQDLLVFDLQFGVSLRLAAYLLPIGVVPQSAHAVVTHRNQIPGIYLRLEPQPLSAFDDNPIFNEDGAARFLGISAERMKKWRQRNQGPDYLQYGRGGPVLYELNALMAFRAANKVKVGARP